MKNLKGIILIFHRILPHYRLGVFSAIHRKLKNTCLCIGKNGPPGTFLSKRSPDFPHKYVYDFYPLKTKESFVFLDVLTPVLSTRPKVIICEFALLNLSLYMLLLLRFIFRYKLILWSHGYNVNKGFNPRRSFPDKIRCWLMDLADAVLLYGGDAKRNITPYIANRNKLFVAPNTLDTESLVTIRHDLDKTGKQQIKKKLKMTARYNLIFIGRLLENKEPDRLIDVFKLLHSQLGADVQLHMVGNGLMKTKLEARAGNLPIKFWGAVTGNRETGELLYASDLMVMPGFLGLSIVHAFCFDCPVVSQAKGEHGPFHRPEVEYLTNHKTGFLTPCGNNQKMAATIYNYLLDENIKKEMKKELRYTIKNTCSLDNMVQGFKDAIDFVISKPC